MPDPRPVYLVGPAGALRDRVIAELSLPSQAVFGDVDGFLAEWPPPGVVLILGGRLDGPMARLLAGLATGRGEWTPCLVRDVGGETEVRTVSVGWAEGLEAVAAFRDGDHDRLLELRRAVHRIARARHDINNPLTSGMAETQLLLMDVEDEPTREALETIQHQLRRIRDLVAATGGLRSGEG